MVLEKMESLRQLEGRERRDEAARQGRFTSSGGSNNNGGRQGERGRGWGIF